MGDRADWDAASRAQRRRSRWTGCCRMPGFGALVGQSRVEGDSLPPEVGRTRLEDGRFGCSVEIIFATIRFCNSPWSVPIAQLTRPAWLGARSGAQPLLPLPGGAGRLMQAGAGSELTWDTVALPFGVAWTPTTMMSPAGAWPLTVMEPSRDLPTPTLTSLPFGDTAGGRSGGHPGRIGTTTTSASS